MTEDRQASVIETRPKISQLVRGLLLLRLLLQMSSKLATEQAPANYEELEWRLNNDTKVKVAGEC